MSHAEQMLPSGVNPLSLHIMRRTKEYLSDPNLKQEASGTAALKVDLHVWDESTSALHIGYSMYDCSARTYLYLSCVTHVHVHALIVWTDTVDHGYLCAL